MLNFGGVGDVGLEVSLEVELEVVFVELVTEAEVLELIPEFAFIFAMTSFLLTTTLVTEN